MCLINFAFQPSVASGGGFAGLDADRSQSEHRHLTAPLHLMSAIRFSFRVFATSSFSMWQIIRLTLREKRDIAPFPKSWQKTF